LATNALEDIFADQLVKCCICLVRKIWWNRVCLTDWLQTY